MDMGSFMQQFVQQLINGISLGSIYALVALGYTMIYGIIKLINFAHGDIYMLGAYFGFIATTMFGFSFIPAILFSMACAALAGIIIERVAYRPMRNAPRIAILITAIGVSFFLEYSMILIATPQPRTFPAVFEATIYHFGPLVVNSQQIVILISALILMAVLTYIVQNTKAGKAMRAVSFDADAARLMGINIDRVISMTFALGSALAAAGGVLVGIYYNSIDPLMGMVPGIKAFVAAVLGGIGIIPGAMLGGIILGVVEAMVSGFFSSTFRDAAAFAILILILLYKPAGILGKNVRFFPQCPKISRKSWDFHRISLDFSYGLGIFLFFLCIHPKISGILGIAEKSPCLCPKRGLHFCLFPFIMIGQGFSACGGPLLRHNSLPPHGDPRRAFFMS